MASLTTIPSSVLPLCVAEQAEFPLTKAQKTFNALIEKISSKRTVLAAWVEGIEAFNQSYQRDFLPLIEQELALKRALALQLDCVHDQKSTTKAKKRALSVLIASLSETLLMRDPSDLEAKVLYGKYTQSDWDKEQALMQTNMRAELEATFGIELEEGLNLDSPDAVMAEIERALHAQAEARQEAKRARQQAHAKPKKPTPQQAAKEAVQAAMEKNMSQSIREVYRKLASALHPDREPDPAEQHRKTTLMQAVNQAYEKGDLLKLLELQLAIEQIDQAHLANVNPERLIHYIAVLQAQLAELEQEIAYVAQPVAQQFVTIGQQRLTPKKILRYLAEDCAECKKDIAALQRELQRISAPDSLKIWLQSLR